MGFLLLVLFCAGVSPEHYKGSGDIAWTELDTGLYTAEMDGPYQSQVSDSKITLLRIDPQYFDFEMIVATEGDSTLRTIKDWCEMKGLSGAVNAGMYSLKDHLSGVGYTRNYGHINNAAVKEYFNALAVFNPKNSGLPALQIADMRNQEWESILQNYNCCFQSIRMIDNTGKAVYWQNKRVLKCSMTVLATDTSGHVLFLFTRSPYSVNDIIDFLLKSKLNIQSAMYLEGGPEASLYARTAGKEIIKFGSYVSYSNRNDDNNELRKMPNVLGFRKKTTK